MRHPHHFKIAFALAISAGSWGIYWLPQRILEDGGLTGGWGTIAQMIIGVLILSPIALWRKINGKTFGRLKWIDEAENDPKNKSGEQLEKDAQFWWRC